MRILGLLSGFALWFSLAHTLRYRNGRTRTQSKYFQSIASLTCAIFHHTFSLPCHSHSGVGRMIHISTAWCKPKRLALVARLTHAAEVAGFLRLKARKCVHQPSHQPFTRPSQNSLMPIWSSESTAPEKSITSIKATGRNSLIRSASQHRKEEIYTSQPAV